MAKKNFYDVLGVSKSASQDEIKSAYKKLSLKHHPDRNQNDPNAKQRFAEISEAYQVLSDPKQRQSYDFTGQGGGGGFGGFEGFDFSGFGDFGDADDIFSSFFGGGRKRQQQQSNKIPGEDIGVTVSISLEDAFNGAKMTFEYFKMDKCDTCTGSGIKEGPKQKCTYCNGVGYVTINAILTVIKQTCPECNGSKYSSKSVCGGCSGKKRKKVKATETISIPCGIDNNQVIRISGAGDVGIGAPTGSLLVTIKVKDHPIFRRDKGDLYITKETPVSSMVLGGEILVDGISERGISVSIPEGSSNNARIRVNGKGMRYYNSDSRGSLYVDLIPTIPSPSQMDKANLELWNNLYKLENQKEPPNRKKFGFF